ncbi:uncharacterized protein LOC123312542 isoform X2 [Coccinella septempunctata]|nr:uncharacterized protein LOC123312542 isoform X2 [Coccinella septempunctata]
MSSNQLMIIDGQPTHQVIVNQQPVVYQKNPAAGIITIPQPQPQTFYYMDNTSSVPAELTQTESVEVQPIVLNHRLGSQISLVPRPAKSSMAAQQLNFLQQVQRQNCPTKIIRPPTSSIHHHLSHPVQRQEQQTQHFTTSSSQHKPQEHFVDQASVSLERPNSIYRQQMNQSSLKKVQSNPVLDITSKMNTMQNSKEADQQEVVTLRDGNVIGVTGYKELLLKQQQQRLNILPDHNPKKIRAPSLSRPRPKLTNPGSMMRNNSSKFSPKRENSTTETAEASRVNPQAISTPSYPENSTTRRAVPAQTENINSVRTIPGAQYAGNLNNQKQQQQQMVQNASSRPEPPPQQVPQQQQQRQNGHNYIIQPARVSANKSAQFSLPSCVPSSQLQKIIEKTPVSEDYPDSIRMLILLANGEQRLITFSLPNQACTIQEILEQVGVPLTPETPLEVSEANTNGINYVVTVGFRLSNSQGEDSNETSGNHQGVAESQTQPTQTPATEDQSPELTKEVEQPRYIEGKMAVCGYCGYLSDDFNKCMRCKTKLPENVKAITANSKKVENKQPLVKKVDQMNSPNTNGTKELTQSKKKPSARSKNNENETVILTLSSDDEDDTEKSSGPINENILQKLGASVTLSPVIKKEPSMNDIQKSTLNVDNDKDNASVENSKSVLLQCRTVRIGSYRTFAKDSVVIDRSSMTLKVLHLTTKNIVTLTIERTDIVKVLICFQKQLPLLFYYLKPYMGSTIRDLLGMKENDVNYYDPLSDTESHRRLTILPENIPDEVRMALIEIYRPSMNGNNILEELTLKEANDILIKTCPKELTLAHVQPTAGSLFEVKHLFTYPPEGRGRISINTEDYMCLASDQFLNDVIIDFYLKYLVNALVPEEQEKIHVFSTFFYKRLTTKPVKASRKSQPAELDPLLSPAEKRHARVKTWTKNIDLFEKDFVVVPINENCHWFLAIICYPGLDGCQTFDGNPIKIEIAPKKKSRTKTTIGSVTITPMKKEEPPCEDLESDKDEAEGDESELESDDSTDDTQKVTSHANRPPIKQPCILIFDSLAGTGRSRVVATLRDYLTCEYKAKYNKEKIFTKDVIKGACPKVPQQTNFTDCGLYLLQYVEHFLMEPIKDYYIPINSLKNWFDELTVTRKREDISILIKKLMMDYNKDTALLPDILFPTKNGTVVDQFAEDEEAEEEVFDHEEFESPPVGSETEIDTSMSVQEEEMTKSESASIQASSESASEDKLDEAVSNTELFKSDLSELTLQKPQSSRDALSYLKAKRIIRNKNFEGPSCKKTKFSE